MSVLLFEEQVARKPNLYPWTQDFIDSIWSGFWTPNEFSFKSDYAQFKVEMSHKEQEVITRTLCAIGQVEIAVKRFWAQLGDNLPHPSMYDLGYAMANTECYSSDTEVLTPDGWRFLTDMKIGDRVYEFNEDSSINETLVENKIDRNYSGPMYQFGERSNQCLVTPNHEMVVKNKSRGVHKIEAKNFKAHPDIYRPLRGSLDIEGEGLSNLERVYIAIQADGTVSYRYDKNGDKVRRGVRGGYTHQLRFRRTRKIERIRHLLESSGVPFSEFSLDKGGVGFSVHLSPTESYKDFSWVSLDDKSGRWCKEFIEELWLWDGSEKSQGYYTSIESNANIVQAIGTLAGYRTTMGYSYGQYRVLCNNSKEKWVRFMDLSNKIVDYDGIVSCISVPSGMIVTRRNGKTFIAGNCIHNQAYEKLLETLGLGDSFEVNLKEPVFAGRYNYLKKYLSKKYEDDRKQYVYAIILFTLFVENVSLFSQFYTVLWFNRHKNLLKDTAQQIQYTRLEESLHSLIGTKLINTLREEYPELFDEDLEKRVEEECLEAFNAESGLVDWMLDGYETEGLNSSVLKEYIKNRLNVSMSQIGFSPQFEIDRDLLEQTRWMEEETLGNNMTDFFHKKPVEYSRNNRAFEEEELF